MDPENMVLSELDPKALTTVKLHHEWHMDPPPFILRRFSDELVKEIYSIKVKYLAQVAKIDVRMAEIRGSMLEEIGKTMHKHLGG